MFASRRVPLLCAALSSLFLAAQSQAQQKQPAYPAETIRLISPFGTGGLTDSFGRGLAIEMARHLGQSIIVENKPGAAGLNGTASCAAAKPDGYTICMLPIDAMSYAPHMRKTMPFDPDTAIAPIAQALYVSQALVVHKSVDAKSIRELIALARKMPEGLHYSNSSVVHLMTMTKLAKDNDIKLISVPYKSGGEATTALINGDVKIGLFGVGNIAPFMASGDVRAIAIHGPKRPALMPDVPTMEEQGYPVGGQGWIGLAAPGGTPEPILDTLYDAAMKAMKDPEFIKRFYEGLGLDPRYMTRQEFTVFLKKDRTEAGELARLAGIEPQ
ncbi:tripartite tricarboxylate transporter substrate binding protein [Roseiarcaceae bacterium H3SJ34-1]|uniref:Bug family tripartite tricarboxylate transporter substrate binding protein n=1 Tax=Terripilifer ovatus TaxID=3032367 RepID=UPI003AB93B20|nr:tripartite tricarboxylate transporter substrate binding protein [Roseiarcaceae bacterium H3SJ34-1]